MLIKAITGKGAYAAKPGPSKSERAANRGFALFSIVLTLSILVMGVIFYVGIKSFVRHSPPQPGRTVFEPTKSRSLIEHAIDRYAGSESLSLLPEPISISEVNVSSALEFSYYGMT